MHRELAPGVIANIDPSSRPETLAALNEAARLVVPAMHRPMLDRGTRPAIINAADAKEHGPRFLGTPERWLDDPHWRCPNGHVSRNYLRSEELGRAACFECGGVLWITFPEDVDDTLENPS